MATAHARRNAWGAGIAGMTFALLCVPSGCGREPAAQPAVDADRPSTEVASGFSQQRWTAGVHYEELAPSGEPAVDGKVEVLEFFYFGCPHCYKLEPSLASWMKSKPAYVEFRRVPATWMPAAKAHARLFYTLQALGREDLYPEVFATLHVRHGSLYRKEEQETLKLHLNFAGAHGVSSAEFLQAHESEAVAANLKRADQLARRYRVIGVPVMVINSRYKTSLTQAGGEPGNLFALISDLAASEHRR